MHRFSWDMHLAPIGEQDPAAGGDDDATGAVPHRTYPGVNAPWAPPGNYTVRLSANGTSMTQPLLVRLDPRVRTPAAAIARLSTLSRQLYDGAVAARAAHDSARALVARLDRVQGADVSAFKAQVESLAPASASARAARARPGRGAAASAPTLESASNALLAAVMAMQSADVEPTALQLAAAERARADYSRTVARWNAARTSGLATLNARRKAAGQAMVPGM